MDYELANYIVLSINTFMCLSSPVNLLIYCGMSKQFRDEIRQILARYCKGISCLFKSYFSFPSRRWLMRCRPGDLRPLTQHLVIPRASTASLVLLPLVRVNIGCPYLAERLHCAQMETTM